MGRVRHSSSRLQSLQSLQRSCRVMVASVQLLQSRMNTLQHSTGQHPSTAQHDSAQPCLAQLWHACVAMMALFINMMQAASKHTVLEHPCSATKQMGVDHCMSFQYTYLASVGPMKILQLLQPSIVTEAQWSSTNRSLSCRIAYSAGSRLGQAWQVTLAKLCCSGYKRRHHICCHAV